MTRPGATPRARAQQHLPKQSLEVKLPVFGVGLGRVSHDAVHVHINNRMPYGQADKILCVPVKRVGDTSRYGFASLDSKHEAGPTRADLGISIGMLEGCGPKQSALARRASRELTSRGIVIDATLRERKPYVDVKVARELWHPQADGVLFLMLYGQISDEESLEALAAQVAAQIRARDVERCIVPSRAIAHPTDEQPEPRALCFALGSCQYTTGMLDGTPAGDELAPGPADQSYARLSRQLASTEPAEAAWRPELLLLTGDQVYVDATAGLFDPSIGDGRYLRPYEQFYSSSYVQHVTRQVHVCAMLDDHEIRDNFENEPSKKLADDDGQPLDPDLEQGRQAYIDFQRQGSLLDPPADGTELWAKLRFAGYDFFIADTRTERETRSAGDFLEKTIMSVKQFDALKDWLSQGPKDGRPRFVLSPAILLPRKLVVVGSDPPAGPGEPTSVLQSDSWDGYPASFDALFQLLAGIEDQNVIFLSGDEHRCCFAEAQLLKSRIKIHSVHSSGLYCPYVFANASEHDFVSSETLSIPARNKKHSPSEWEVKAQFAPEGHGYTLIQIETQPEAWKVVIRFSLDSGDTRQTLVLPRYPVGASN